MWHGGKQLPHFESVEFPVASEATALFLRVTDVDLCHSTTGKFLANEHLVSLVVSLSNHFSTQTTFIHRLQLIM